MTTPTEQPDALRLAKGLREGTLLLSERDEAAEWLERLHAENEALRADVAHKDAYAEQLGRELSKADAESRALRSDAERLDLLERAINEQGEIHLHDGNHPRGTGLGLRPGQLVRTLREAIDAMKGQP